MLERLDRSALCAVRRERTPRGTEDCIMRPPNVCWQAALGFAAMSGRAPRGDSCPLGIEEPSTTMKPQTLTQVVAESRWATSRSGSMEHTLTFLAPNGTLAHWSPPQSCSRCSVRRPRGFGASCPSRAGAIRLRSRVAAVLTLAIVGAAAFALAAGAFAQGSINLDNSMLANGVAIGIPGNYYGGTYGMEVWELSGSTARSSCRELQRSGSSSTAIL